MSNNQAVIHEAPQQDTGGLAVTARRISKSFGGTHVLSNLDLHVPAGQFLAIVGRSGCGKSTLLRLLADLDQPDAGEITLGEGDDRRAIPALCFRSRAFCPGREFCPMWRWVWDRKA